MSNDAMFVQTNTYLDNMAREFKYSDYTPLVLLYMWDMFRDFYEDLECHPGDTGYGEYELVPGVNLKKIWDTWLEAPFGGFDWLPEDVVEWLAKEGLIQFVEEEDQDGEDS